MARLAAMEIAEYYPTPNTMVDAINAHVAPLRQLKNQFYRIYDPCCADGEAVARFAAQLHTNDAEVQVWGNEIHLGRAEAAKDKLDLALWSPLEAVQWRPSSGIASCLYLNPPYDYSEAAGAKRMETYFLNRATQALVHGGLLIFIVPVRAMTWETAGLLANNYEQLELFRFPDAEYERFKQVVVFGIRKASTNVPDYRARQSMNVEYQSDRDIRALPVVGQDVQHQYELKPVQSFKAELYRYNWSDDEIIGLLPAPRPPVTEAKEASIEVLQMPKIGHLASMLTSGMMGTLMYPGEVLKGNTVKGAKRTVTAQGDEIITKITTDWQTHIIRVTAAGLEYYDQDKALPFLQENAPRLAMSLSKRLKPTGETASAAEWLAISELSQRRPWPNGKGYGLLADQKRTVVAGLRSLERYHVFNCIAEMGYGKTTVGCGIIAVRKRYPVLIVAPRHLLEKWAREIKEVIAGAVPVIVDKVGELQAEIRKQRLMPQRKLIIIIANTMISYGPGWEDSYATRRTITRDDHGFGLLTDIINAKKRGASSAEISRLQHQALGQMTKYPVCPICGAVLDLESDLKGRGPHVCRNALDDTGRNLCMANLYQTKEKVSRRWPLAQYIKDHAKGFFTLFIADECHEYKSGDSLRGAAYAQLSDTIGDTVNLTGTFYGGKASTIFYLLYRSNPWMRKEWGHHEEQRWVETYGRIETTFKEIESTSVYNAAKTTSPKYTEIPGSSPQMMEWILKTSVFKSIKDLGIELPAYTDAVVRLDMTPAQRTDYTAVESTLWNAVTNESWRNLSSWLQWSLARPNSGFRNETIAYTTEDGIVEVEFDGLVATDSRGDPLSTELLPKERYLVERCRQELGEGRNVIVFLRQTATRDIRSRLLAILNAAGIPAENLPDSLPAAQREAWLMQNTPRVLLTNPKRVETGLDLVMYHTYVFYEIEYSLYTLWQASHRLHRPGQKQEVRGVFLVYNDTMEARAIDLIGRKMAAGQQMYGDDVAGALVDDVDTGSFAQELVDAIKKGSVAQALNIFGATQAEQPDAETVKPSAGALFGYEAGRGNASDYTPKWMTVPALYETENEQEPYAVIKLFQGGWTWWIQEYDPASGRAFGLVEGHEVELGYFDLNELAAVKGQLGLAPERDLWFQPRPMWQLHVRGNPYAAPKPVPAPAPPAAPAELEPEPVIRTHIPHFKQGDVVWWKLKGALYSGAVQRDQRDEDERLPVVLSNTHSMAMRDGVTINIEVVPLEFVHPGTPPQSARPNIEELLKFNPGAVKSRARKSSVALGQLALFEAPQAQAVATPEAELEPVGQLPLFG